MSCRYQVKSDGMNITRAPVTRARPDPVVCLTEALEEGLLFAVGAEDLFAQDVDLLGELGVGQLSELHGDERYVDVRCGSELPIEAVDLDDAGDAAQVLANKFDERVAGSQHVLCVGAEDAVVAVAVVVVAVVGVHAPSACPRSCDGVVGVRVPGTSCRLPHRCRGRSPGLGWAESFVHEVDVIEAGLA